jgi:hypothetical protein
MHWAGKFLFFFVVMLLLVMVVIGRAIDVSRPCLGVNVYCERNCAD